MMKMNDVLAYGRNLEASTALMSQTNAKILYSRKVTSDHQRSLDGLPAELKLMILEYLSPKQVLVMASVSRDWRRASVSDVPFRRTMKQYGLNQTLPMYPSCPNRPYPSDRPTGILKRQKLNRENTHVYRKSMGQRNVGQSSHLLLEDPTARYYNYYRHFCRNECKECKDTSGILLHFSKKKGESRQCPLCYAKTTIPTYTSVAMVLQFAAEVSGLGFSRLRIRKTSALKMYCLRSIHLKDVPFETVPNPYASCSNKNLYLYQLHDLYRVASNVHGGRLGFEFAIWTRNERRRRRYAYYERRWNSVEARVKSLIHELPQDASDWWKRHVLRQNYTHRKRFQEHHVNASKEALEHGCNMSVLQIIYGFLQQCSSLPNIEKVRPKHLVALIQGQVPKPHDEKDQSFNLKSRWYSPLKLRDHSTIRHGKRKRPEWTGDFSLEFMENWIAFLETYVEDVSS